MSQNVIESKRHRGDTFDRKLDEINERDDSHTRDNRI